MKITHLILWSLFSVSTIPVIAQDSDRPEDTPATDTPATEIPATDVEATEAEADQKDKKDKKDKKDETATDASESSAEQGEEDKDDKKEEEDSDPVVIRTEIPKSIRLTETENGLKLLSPFSPKPMQRAPAGWTYAQGDANQAYTRDVKLSSGKTLTLTIIPYVLAPEQDDKVVQVLEPGYQPEHGYQQTKSVTAVLEKSSTALAKAASTLDDSITVLNELVNSLPKQNSTQP